jgi:hypothetical protein
MRVNDGPRMVSPMKITRINSTKAGLHSKGPLRSLFFVLLIIAGIWCLLPATAAAGPADLSQGLPAAGDISTYSLGISCRNMNTGEGIFGARIYLDGGYAGITSGKDGSLVVPSLSHGKHTVRVVQRGFLENISTVQIPDEKESVIRLHPAKLIPVGNTGPVRDRMDIVFVPSSTEYDCTKQQKIQTDYYTANEANFRKDVDKLIEEILPTLETRMLNQSCLPEGAMQRYNFYYYSDPGDFADAFKGCAGTLPEDFWEEAPFTDVAIIVYPTYKGFYKGPPCEPNGCSSSMGPGTNSWFKTPADSGSIFLHEAGHAAFGLIDTYCGETYYTENEPSPNIWASQSACVLAATGRNWDPSGCRQVAQPAGKAGTCTKNFWKYDPEPDLMGSSVFVGKLGPSATLHIHYILDNINRWKL